MLTGLRNIPSQDPVRINPIMRNSITEGIVLHTRNLCDFCTSTDSRDIRPADLVDDYNHDPKYTKLRDLMSLLKDKYDADTDPKNPNSTRQIFNRRLAHPTKSRGLHFEYAPYLDRVLPVLQEIANEMVALGVLPPPGRYA